MVPLSVSYLIGGRQRVRGTDPINAAQFSISTNVKIWYVTLLGIGCVLADNHAWLQEWEKHIKPELLKLIFDSLRRRQAWNVHVRNRGMSPQDEIEVAMERDFSQRSSAVN